MVFWLFLSGILLALSPQLVFFSPAVNSDVNKKRARLWMTLRMECSFTKDEVWRAPITTFGSFDWQLFRFCLKVKRSELNLGDVLVILLNNSKSDNYMNVYIFC